MAPLELSVSDVSEMIFNLKNQLWGRIFSCVRPFCERAVSNLDS
jgi:hypothetical protein